ncbi:hypothetical protein QQ045_005759 [Rhodiola kirilowii]
MDGQAEELDNCKETEVAPALIAVCPTQKSVSVAVGGPEKRVTTVAIRKDNLFVSYADIFGTVWVFGLGGSAESQAMKTKKPSALLAHYCSIITRLMGRLANNANPANKANPKV